ncbi:MAG: restriction endonuclease [Acidobacteriota bacterium]|nr:restriction endonuclease [Acidobacteriota bacterium]
MSEGKISTAKQKGDQFEEEVAELYRVMGYEVKRHVPVCGQEVDILATRRVQGGGPYTLIIECKYKGGGSLAGNEEVQSIAGAYNIAKVSNLVSGCILVTTNGFSLAAQEAAKSAGIHVTTKRELISNLLDFSQYLNRLQERYLSDFGGGEGSWYIQSRGKQGGEVVESLDDYVDQWLPQHGKAPLIILGSYGTGKSSFCRHYAARLASLPNGVTPVIIPLRDFPKAVKIESLIRDFLEEECDSMHPRFDTFWRMYQEGLLLILFDGLDEMATRMDRATLEANLSEIEKFTGTVNNVIVTCRPELFVSIQEETAALNPVSSYLSERVSAYERVELTLWTDEQVSRYVKKRVRGMSPRLKHSPQYYIDTISRIPGLADLSVRAVHLDMIIKMMPVLAEKGQHITRPNLYQAYLERELSRESVQNKRLKIITDEDRLKLLRTVAAGHFFKSEDALDFELASQIIQTQLGIAKADVESVTRDFLNRSFLMREGDTYRFAHKSIGEYLFAQEIHIQLTRGNVAPLLEVLPTATVAGIVLDLFGGILEFDSLVDALKIDHNVLHYSRDEAPLLYFAALCLVEPIDVFASTSKIRVDDREVIVSRDHRFAYLHMLRDPMTSIIGWGHMLKSSPEYIEEEQALKPISAGFTKLLKVWKHFKEFVLQGSLPDDSEINSEMARYY